VRLVHSGVDTARFTADARRRREARAALAIPSDADVVMMAATLNRQKGVAVGVEAFRRLAGARPRLHLVVVGDGPERARLAALARDQAGGARVRFTGDVAEADMPRHYAAADIFLYPTLRVEGMPRAILEAMSTGLAVVASDRGGIRTAIRDGHTGVLLAWPSAELLATATARLLDDHARRAALGQRAAAVARDQFDLGATVATLLGMMGAPGMVERGRA
jgi:phosphatidylinositol alpha-1,6-mannosyltransferase